MKTEWDSYLDQQLANPAVRQAYEEETKVLSIGMLLAKQRKRKGMTQPNSPRRSAPVPLSSAAPNADRKT